MKYESIRRSMIEAAKQMEHYRLISLCGGNVSVRTPDGSILVTPSGMGYENMQPEDICVLDAEGHEVECIHRPSSDTAALVYIFQHRPDIHALIHTHQPYATAVGFVTDYFPPCLVTQIDALRGGVHVAPFTVSSDIGMGILTVEHAHESLAVILRGHGVMAIGYTLDACLTAAVYLEESSQTYLAALSAHAVIEPLPDDVVAAEAGDMEQWMSYLQGKGV